jgi:hypothetical protein
MALLTYMYALFAFSEQDYVTKARLRTQPLTCHVFRYFRYSSPNTIRAIKSRRLRQGGACSTYGGEERFIEGFSGKTRRKETTWRTEALQTKVILKWILEKWTGVFPIAVVTPPQLYICPSAPADELITFLGNISWHT